MYIITCKITMSMSSYTVNILLYLSLTFLTWSISLAPKEHKRLTMLSLLYQYAIYSGLCPHYKMRLYYLTITTMFKGFYSIL